MDLALYLRVLWRFRLIAGLGLVLALSLSYVSLVRVEFDGVSPRFSYRTPEVWESTSMLLLTQRGFPWGRSSIEENPPEAGRASDGPRFGDLGRFHSLTAVYARLAESDRVRALIRRGGPLGGTYRAAPLVTNDGSGPVPIMAIAAYANSPRAANRLAERATSAFQRYIAGSQVGGGIPPEERVELVVVNEPRKATLFKARSLTKPLFTFLFVVLLTIALVFVTENLRPRPRLGRDVAPTPLPESSRRTA